MRLTPQARRRWSMKTETFGAAMSGEALAQELLALLATLAAGTLRAAEELGELRVAGALGVLDVGLEAKRVAQRLLGEPDEVVVLVGGAGDLAAFGLCRHERNLLSWWAAAGAFPGFEGGNARHR